MPRSLGSVRLVINSQLLLIGALVSHFAGGGSFIPVREMVTATAFIAFLLFLGKKKTLSGPTLALLVTLAQSAGHIILGGMSNSSATMLLSHLTGGLISYWIVQKSEALWEFLANPIRALILRLAREFIIPRLTKILSQFSVRGFFVNPSEIQAHTHRGPPLTEGFFA